MASRAFHDFLREHRSGHTHDLLSDALQQLVAAVTDEGRAGKLTFTVSVKPLGKGDGLEVACAIKLAAPEPAAGVSIFFPTPESNLVRQDPRQQALELREIGPGLAHQGVA